MNLSDPNDYGPIMSKRSKFFRFTGIDSFDLFGELYDNLLTHFQIECFNDLNLKPPEEVISFINSWYPDPEKVIQTDLKERSDIHVRINRMSCHNMSS